MHIQIFAMGRKETKAMKNAEIIDAAKTYLLTRIENGLCLEFHQLRHGPSLAWTTACVGSTLAEFQVVLPAMIEALLSQQWDNGGWSYNQNFVSADADSTLRVIQFLGKAGFHDQKVIDRAERFVISHQQADGGIATYLPKALATMGYSSGAWTTSHPCVTALAASILQNQSARNKAKHYITDRLKKGDARAYWWQTPWYVRYESGWPNGENIGNDPVELGLALLLKAKFGKTDKELMARLLKLQLGDGSFLSSRQFRIPRPNQFLDDITEQTEVVEDRARIFSTAAAVVAISRQEALLN
ncbi:MAG: hypothetical protein A2663_01690 [Candidatus Buchananbacteria bacterium RIFCSPHIGHO2_01_FULL_46_12]|uniref:Squalene cyclase C-terminal domain-containing protein n=1 Tax=Candidatus Buchananbacteria bacterium RIFCSPHIGHO2_01_FULL_46_12 TaxID=1797536 RepID=A0A1G1Y855_9BACT|nr:MAG: hypothetical protein A2663_01690 [Candidatus Buchananbacteria bacterium RIFCSPHIGHO2_01_FULL_46_12]